MPASPKPKLSTEERVWLTLHAALAVVCLPLVFTSDTWAARIGFFTVFLIGFVSFIVIERRTQRRGQGVDGVGGGS